MSSANDISDSNDSNDMINDSYYTLYIIEQP